MTLPQLDEVLVSWESRLAAIADNLLELQNEPAYQMLQGTAPGSVQTTGLTAARLLPALDKIPGIYVHFSLLRGLLDRAAAVRQQRPALFAADHRLAELHRLLFTRSIDLPATGVPLAERTLLGGTHRAQCVSPDELLTPMTEAFAAAKDAVLDVSRAWQALADALDQTESRMRRLGAHADADRLLAEARGRVQADPLGALEYLRTHVEPVLHVAEQTVAARAALEAALRRACTDLDALLHAHARALEASAELTARFAQPTPQPLAPQPPTDAQIEACRAWLDRLRARRNDAGPEAITLGLRNWSTTCATHLRASLAVIEALEAATSARRELRGRLDALKAKARVYGLAEQTALADAAREAERLLTTRPVQLEHAAHAVAGYEQQLRRRA